MPSFFLRYLTNLIKKQDELEEVREDSSGRRSILKPY